MSYIQRVYIADGFADDCDELIHRCLQSGTLTFGVFSDIWKEMQLYSLFKGRNSGAEVAELSEEVIHIAKHYMVTESSNFEESIVGLFLVYTLLKLQPYPNFAALRIVQEDLPSIERIELVARQERRQDVLYVLGSVLIEGPVHYHAAVRERGMESGIRKYLEGYSSINKLGVRPKGVLYRQSTELDLINELKNLTIRYTAFKGNIDIVEPGDRNLKYLNSNLIHELGTSLKNVISGIIDDDKKKDDDCSTSADGIKMLKQKAMKAQVKPIRHHVGVYDRSSPSDSDSKHSTEAKFELTTNRKNRGKKRVRRIKDNSSDTDEYTEKDDSSDTTDLNLDNFDQGTQDSLLQEQEIDLEIDTLPGLIQSEDKGKSYEIEIIDQLKNPESEDESPKRRNLKKTILKSRFKRMGMLPVANFQK